MKLLPKDGVSEKNVPMLLIQAVCVIEFLFITLENLFSGLGYYLAEDLVIVPCLLLAGWALHQTPGVFARRRLMLAGAAISWFVIAQCIHKVSGMENHPMATVFLVYLMAFPFASLTDDRDNGGLGRVGGMFVAASLVLVCDTVLLLLNLVPAGLKAHIFWDGARLRPLWHPNIAASYFMIGIGFSLAFCIRARKMRTKALLFCAVVLQLLAMALTNCRTTLLLTGALLGGTLFFRIFQGSWKRFVLGLLAAAVILVGTFKLSGMLYQWNNDRLLASLGTVQTEAAEPPDTAQTTATESLASQEPNAETAPGETTPREEIVIMEDTGILIGDNEQRSLSEDMRSLNGRTQIWEATLKAVRNSKPVMLWGTEYSGTIISIYHWFDVDHAHNSWLETLMRLGLPGFMLSLVFTVLAVWNGAKLLLTPGTELWKKVIAMLAMCVMATGFLEPYLFITNVYYHVTDFTFFFLTGYLDYWSNRKTDAKTV